MNNIDRAVEAARLRAQAEKYGRRARIWSIVAIAFAVASIVLNLVD